MALAKEIMGGGFSAGQAIALGGGSASVAATGSVQGDAALIGASSVIVTAADGTKGVILPAAQPGDEVDIFNNAALTLKVYPPSGAAIAVNGTGLGSANASFAHLTFKAATYKCQSATQWFVNVSA